MKLVREIAADVRRIVDELGWDEFLKRAERAPKPPLQREWFEVAESLNEETSDRALAIVAAAFLDDVLGDLIARRLASEDARAAERVLPRPGEFGRRIDLATCIGLVSPDEAGDLRTIKDIRNRFAHRSLSLSFDDHDIKSKCGALCVLKNATTDGKPLDLSKWPTRDRFRLAVYALTSHLQMLIPTVPCLPSKKDGEWPFGHPLDHVDRWAQGQEGAPPSAP